jgi:hypothetical protein
MSNAPLKGWNLHAQCAATSFTVLQLAAPPSGNGEMGLQFVVFRD